MKEANKSTIYSNKMLIGIFAITAILSGFTVYYTKMNYLLDKSKNDETHQSTLKQEKIQQQDSLIQKKDDSIANQRAMIIFLKKTCDSLRTEK